MHVIDDIMYTGDDVELTCHDGTVRDVIFMPDTAHKSSLLVSAGAGDCKICVTDCATAALLRAMPGHSGHLSYYWTRIVTVFDLCLIYCVYFIAAEYNVHLVRAVSFLYFGTVLCTTRWPSQPILKVFWLNLRAFHPSLINGLRETRLVKQKLKVTALLNMD